MWGCVSGDAQVYGIASKSAHVDRASGALSLTGAHGEAGTAASAFVVMPPGTPTVTSVSINGKAVSNFTTSTYRDVPAVRFGGHWAGVAFGKNPEVGSSVGFEGGKWKAQFSVPGAVLEDLKARNASYPIVYDTDPNSTNDADVPWLAPGRLLIFAKYKPLLNDSLNVSGTIDGKPILVRKAYNTIVRSPGRFIGWWSDVTAHVAADTEHVLELVLPGHQPWTTKAGALNAGNDVAVFEGTTAEGKQRCDASSSCSGFTFELPKGVASCADVGSQQVKLYLKSAASGNGDAAWCTVMKPPLPIGVFFENVEAVYSTDFNG